ncbi:MAG: ATP-binding protein [Nostocaceae cyanobacterium]|nr:ATP-binding protein [Nostocaceae cyanobacterium]
MNKRKRGQSRESLNQLTLLNRITSHIRQSLELQTILDTTVTEVRSFLETDRVKIYKFDRQGNGEVIAESIYGDRLPSLKGLHFPAGDIPPQARELFCKARVRSIVDLQQQQIRLSQPHRPLSTATGELTVEEVHKQSLKNLLQRPVDPCHVEYLSLMGVKSSLVIPIVSGKELWGLLISHNAQPKSFCEVNLQIMQMIAEQVELAITQADLLHTTQEIARREATVNRISTQVISCLETESVLQRVLPEIVTEAQASGGILLLIDTQGEEDFFSFGSQPHLSPGEWLQLLQVAGVNGEPKIVDICCEGDDELEPFLSAFANTKICSLLLVSLKYGQKILGYLSVFRDEIDTEKLWAGYPDADERQQRPRQSFEEWREIKQGQVLEWNAGEIELLKSLGQHLAMAVLQHRLYQQEKEQRMIVEIHNQELEIARTSAEEASRLKSDFLSSTSHELRTPLASTLNYLKLLKEGFYDNEEELQEYIQAAHISAQGLVNIINDILDIAKIEAGRVQLELKAVELKPLLELKRHLFKADSIHRGINFIIECEVERVWADEDKLRQVLINLLSNAFKFTSQGEVRLRVVRQNHSDCPMVEFSVADTGIGIDPSKQELLFEAFVQEDGSIRRRYGGTGLGLTICKRLVELMGGQIWLQSQGKDQGTTVTFILPEVVGV